MQWQMLWRMLLCLLQRMPVRLLLPFTRLLPSVPLSRSSCTSFDCALAANVQLPERPSATFFAGIQGLVLQTSFPMANITAMAAMAAPPTAWTVFNQTGAFNTAVYQNNVGGSGYASLFGISWFASCRCCCPCAATSDPAYRAVFDRVIAACMRCWAERSHELCYSSRHLPPRVLSPCWAAHGPLSTSFLPRRDNAAVGYIYGSGVILSTHDGGHNWVPETPNAVVSNPNAATILALSPGALWHHRAGNRHWAQNRACMRACCCAKKPPGNTGSLASSPQHRRWWLSPAAACGGPPSPVSGNWSTRQIGGHFSGPEQRSEY